MARRSAVILFLVTMQFWSAPRPIEAQLAVIDNANLLQAILQLAQTIQIVNLIIRDLAPLANLTAAVSVAGELAQVVTDIQVIAAALDSRRDIWITFGTPAQTSWELASMREYIASLCRTTAEDGLRAQSLLSRAPMLLQRLQSLLSSVANIIGSVAGHQAATAMLGGVAGHLSVVTAALTSANEPQLCKVWGDRILEQSVAAVQQNLLRDYGVIQPR